MEPRKEVPRVSLPFQLIYTAHMLKRHLDGVLNSFAHPVTSP